MNLIQDIMHCFNFRLPFCLLLKYGTRKYYIALLTSISVRLYRTCILKYLLQAQQFADLLLDEALRPMKEGLGSYITTVSDGWLTVGDPVTNHPGSQSLQLCCRNAKTVQILS